MIRRLSEKDLLFVKNLFFTTILGGVIGILNYLFNIFIARYTDQEIFSIFGSALGVLYIVQIPAVAIQALVTKGIAKNKEKNLNRFKWESLLLFSLMGVLFSIVFFLNKGVVAQIASIPKELVFFLALSFLFSFVGPVGKGLLLGLERIVIVNTVLLFETVLKFVLCLVAIKTTDPLPLLILANSLPAMLTTLFILPAVKFKKVSGTRVQISMKEFVLITISFLLLTAPFTIDLILVNPEFRAGYASISLLGKLVYFASITSASVMFARLSNEDKENNQRKSLMISLALSLFIGLVLSGVFFLFRNYVVDFTVGYQYRFIADHIGVFGLCMTGFAFVYMTANYFVSKGFFRYLYILLFVTLLQIALFVLRNDSINIVIQNQIIVYVSLTFLTLIYLLFKLKFLRNDRSTKDSKGRGKDLQGV